MELFLKDFQEEIRNARDVPKELQDYCINQADGTLLCPTFFNRMDIGNYVNHSEHPNMRYEKDMGYFALCDIHAREELFSNYRELGEPKETWAEYYRHGR